MKYEVQLVWEVAAKVFVEADSQKDAETTALDLSPQLYNKESLPEGYEVYYQGYVDDSMQALWVDELDLFPLENDYAVL